MVFGGANQDLSAYTPPGSGSIEQLDNLHRAQAAAKKYGLDENVLIKLLTAENGLKSDGGNGGGPGQFIASTAKSYGTTQEELRKDPDKAIDLTAKHLKSQIDYFHGDVAKGVAAYTVGAGTVEEALAGPNGQQNWLANADAISTKNKWNPEGAITKYVGDITSGSVKGKDPRDLTREEIRTQTGIKPPVTGTGTGGPSSDPNKIPTSNDFRQTLPDGTIVTDWDGYSKAITGWKVYHDAQQAEKAMGIEQQSKFMDDVIDQVAKEIAVGNLSLTKANAIFNARATSYKTAVDAFNSDAFKYGAPAGAEYVPGFEPDSYAVKTLGMAPKKAQTGNFLDPMAESKAQWQLALDQYNGVSVPTVPNFSEIRGGYNPNYVPTKPNLLTNAPMIPNAPAPQSVATNPYVMAGDIPAPAPGNTPQGFFAQAMQRVKELSNG